MPSIPVPTNGPCPIVAGSAVALTRQERTRYSTPARNAASGQERPPP